MTLKQSVFLIASLILTFSGLTPNAHAQSNRKKQDSSVVVGTLTNVDSSGNEFDIQQTDEHLRKLSLNSQSKIYFVGIPTTGKPKPRPGMGVKATCDKEGRIKTISFTPPVGKVALLGEKRLKMTESELLKEIDKDTSHSISYVEFSKYIYYSPKHGPDSFRKADLTAMAHLIPPNSWKLFTRFHGGHSRVKLLTNGSVKPTKTTTACSTSKSLA